MANPFLVLGGIAISVATAAFGILQVPGWVKSAQDASAKNDISQVTIAQAASLSATGYVKSLVTEFAGSDAVGVKVSTDSNNTVAILVNGAPTTTGKQYAVVATSKSGAIFVRVDGGAIKRVAAAPTTYAAAVSAAALPD